jgi:hypothetical protein
VVEQGAIAAERRSDGIIHRCESVGEATRLGDACREDFARPPFFARFRNIRSDVPE